MRNKLVLVYFAVITVPILSAGPCRAQIGGQLDSVPYWRTKEKSCGPLCLTFLEKYFGGDRKYCDIAKECPPGAQGVSLLDMKQEAQIMGYNAVGFEATLEQLKHLRFPAILQLSLHGGQQTHFVVLLGWDEMARVFRTFDPWQPALVRAPEYDLQAHFTGKGLIVSNRSLPPLDSLLTQSPPQTQWMLFVLVCFDVVFVILIWQSWRNAKTRIPLSQQLLANLMMGFLLCLPACSTEKESAAKGQIASMEESPYDYQAGIILQGAPIRHTFRILNPTDQSIKIEKLEKT